MTSFWPIIPAFATEIRQTKHVSEIKPMCWKSLFCWNETKIKRVKYPTRLEVTNPRQAQEKYLVSINIMKSLRRFGIVVLQHQVLFHISALSVVISLIKFIWKKTVLQKNCDLKIIFLLFSLEILKTFIVSAWNLVRRRFINFQTRRKFLTSSTFGDWWPYFYPSDKKPDSKTMHIFSIIFYRKHTSST